MRSQSPVECSSGASDGSDDDTASLQKNRLRKCLAHSLVILLVLLAFGLTVVLYVSITSVRQRQQSEQLQEQDNSPTSPGTTDVLSPSPTPSPNTGGARPDIDTEEPTNVPTISPTVAPTRSPTSTPTSAPTSLYCPNLLWEDNFDQGDSLDTKDKWEYQQGNGCDINLCGWGNNELQEYSSDNIWIEDGALIIEARNESGTYTSGRIRTKGKLDFRYGYLEASIKVARGQGMWSAFWALPSEEVYGPWPSSGEIDVLENVGRQPDVVHGVMHAGDPPPNNTKAHERISLPRGDELADSYHRYSVFWEEDRIRWFLDGAQYSDQNPNNILPYTWPFNEDFHLVLNIAIGGFFPGAPTSLTPFPQQMKVDYVKLYDKPFGRLLGPEAVAKYEGNVVYSLESSVDDYTFVWSAPEDATILTQDTSTAATITIEFGTLSGYVTVEATSQRCGFTETFSMPVNVGRPGV